MLKQALKFGGVLVLLVMVTLCYPGAFAQGDDHGETYRDSDGHRYYYRDGKYYRHSSLGQDIVASVLSIGGFIDAPPPRHTVYVVGDTRYYHDGRYFYRPAPQGSGYVVVQPPPLNQFPEKTTVNIPNSKGSFTSITMRRSGSGFIGPKGEYYEDYPSVDQLVRMYGND
jgi:hypothetical protein